MTLRALPCVRPDPLTRARVLSRVLKPELRERTYHWLMVLVQPTAKAERMPSTAYDGRNFMQERGACCTSTGDSICTGRVWAMSQM
jgi:hypothetical protein